MRARTAALALFCALSSPAVAARATGPDQVAQAIAARRSRVAEFEVIKQTAQELGFRVWLFGGTAAAFAHYVRSDLAREGGDTRYRESFFDYDFTNIYRSTQDADLVVDATPEQAERLEELIRQRMSFLQGSKEYWEVRLLRHDRVAPGGQVKQALLGNSDFLGQHTDSNSTGMVELTDPPAGERVVRDLRDWESPEPFFLQDVTAGRLHYYWSPTHQQTTRFRQGDNPPLFSVIRYLVKAFQYGLAVEGEDLARVKGVIEAFDPEQDYADLSPWAKGWLERYGPNLIRHAVDVEYAWNTLQELGLREKLIGLSKPDQEKSLGWWLSREPLRTRPLGHGDGHTAGELGVTVVAHETSDFLAYESLTRDRTGRPNVLISRPGRVGETAAAGPGFYTQRGRTGARGTGLTIRFQVDPAARQGEDFTLDGDRVLVTNRAALTVIPESLDLSYPDYLKMLRDDAFDPADRGVWMKLMRRLRIKPLSPEDERQAVLIALYAGHWRGAQLPEAFLSEWLSHPIAQRHPEVISRLFETVWQAVQDQPTGKLSPLLKGWFGNPVSERYPELKAMLFRKVSQETLAPRLRQGSRDLLAGWFSLPLSAEHPELVDALIEAGACDFVIAEVFRQRPEWADHPELLRKLMERSPQTDWIVRYILNQPEWREQAELFQYYLEHPGHPADRSLAILLRSGPPPALDRPEVVKSLLEHASWESFLAEAGAAGDPRDWLETSAPALRTLADTLSQPRWKDHPELVRALLEALPPSYDSSLESTARRVVNLLRYPQWAGHPELVLTWVLRADHSWDFVLRDLLSQGPWRNNPVLREGGSADGVILAGRVERSLSALRSGGEACR